MNFNEVAVWPGPGPADPQSKLERIPSLEPEADLAALLAYAASDNPGGASSSPAFQDFSTPHSLPKEGTTETALWQIKPKTHPSPPRFNLQNGTHSQIHCAPGLIIRCLFQYFPGNCSLRIKAPAYCKRALHKDSGMGAWEEH